MKLILFLLALVVIASANPFGKEFVDMLDKIKGLPANYDTALKAIANLDKMAIDHHGALKKKFEEAQNDRTARSIDARTPTQACTNAVSSFLTTVQNSTCNGYVGTYFTIINNVTVRGQAVDNYCGNCYPNIQTQFNAVIQNCNRTDFTNQQQLAFFLYGFYNNYMCSTDQSNNRCAKVIINLDPSVYTQTYTNLTTTSLNSICSVCVIKAIRIIASGSQYLQANGLIAYTSYTTTYAAIRVVCVQIKGQYCILQLQALSNAAIQLQNDVANGKFNGGDFTNFLNIACYPCFRAVIARIAVFTPAQSVLVTGIATVFGKLCRKNPSGQYCLVVLLNSIQSVLPTLLSGGSTGTCANLITSGGTSCSTDTNCKNLLNNLISKGGCCWALFYDFSGGAFALSQFNSIVQTCIGSAPPAPCPSYANATLTLTYANLDINYLTNNMAAFQANVIIDLQTSNGILSYGSITVVFGACANPPCKKRDATNSTTIVTVTSASVPGTASGSLTDTQVTCDSVCANTPAQNPSADVTVNSQATALVVQSSSSALSVSFVLLAALFVLQFFF